MSWLYYFSSPRQFKCQFLLEFISQLTYFSIRLFSIENLNLPCDNFHPTISFHVQIVISLTVFWETVIQACGLTRRFSLFFYWINKINKQMEYLVSWWAVIWSAASGCFDLVRWCCRVMLSTMAEGSTAGVTSACSIYMFLTSNFGPRKHYLWKKKCLVEK